MTDLNQPDRLPAFSGTFRYEAQLEWTAAEGNGPVWLELGQVYETAQVWINGEEAGIRICPPYRLEVGGYLREGANAIAVEVTNTLVKQETDPFSRFAQLEPGGLLGPVRLVY